MLSYHPTEIENCFDPLIQKLNSMPNKNTADRLEWISRNFLERPYLLGACGEGPEGQFDQNPLYRHDGFDCVTFVNTVLAMNLCSHISELKNHIALIGYQDKNIKYINRHHFMSVDWNPSNEKLGIIKNITSEIIDEKKQSVHEEAHAIIDKPNWYRFRQLQDIKLLDVKSADEMNILLNELRALANQVKIEKSEMKYIPLKRLFDAESRPNHFIFNQIPAGSIIEIVRPNWNLKDKIGTNLNVSHLGFVFRNNNELIFRHASEIHKKIVDEPLTSYLQNKLESPSIKGIHLLLVI